MKTNASSLNVGAQAGATQQTSKAIFTSINQLIDDYFMPHYNELVALVSNEAQTDEIELIKKEIEAMHTLIQSIKDGLIEVDKEILKNYNF